MYASSYEIAPQKVLLKFNFVKKIATEVASSISMQPSKKYLIMTTLYWFFYMNQLMYLLFA